MVWAELSDGPSLTEDELDLLGSMTVRLIQDQGAVVVARTKQDDDSVLTVVVFTPSLANDDVVWGVVLRQADVIVARVIDPDVN